MDIEKWVGEVLPKVAATQMAKSIFYALEEHVKARVERNTKLISKYMDEKVDQGETLRNDWFSENQMSNRRIAFRLLEKTIKEIINDSEEKKSEYIAKFWVNICLTSNSDIDEATAFSYWETIESLSWRQLCIIRLIPLYRNQKVETLYLSNKDVEEMPQDEQTQFFSISRDFQNLMVNEYIIGGSVPQLNYNPFVRTPGSGELPDYTKRLHSLMNLHEIPMEDIEQTFSIWHVRKTQTSG